jgi:heme/copper-type cytochrome/quinol oxidase subunit 2
MLFYQHIRIDDIIFRQRLNTRWEHYSYAVQPKIFYPEIFIPQIIILLSMGSILLYFLMQQIKYGSDKKYINIITVWFISCILFFVLIFIVGLIIMHELYGEWSVIDPLLSIILGFFVIIISVFLFIFIYKYNFKNDKIPKRNFNPPKKFIDNNTINYKILTVILLGIVIISFFMFFILASIHPWTDQTIYWEDQRWPEGTVLPGMNISYNLIIERNDALRKPEIIIHEYSNDGNWTINTKITESGPILRKTITFTNFVPINTTKNRFDYSFELIVMNERGPSEAMKEGITTFVTYDINEYNSSQLSSDTSPPAIISMGSFRSTIYESLMDYAIITFSFWMIITVIYVKNSKIISTLIKNFKKYEN